MIPTALSAQVGGAISPGVHVGGAVNPGLPFEALSFEASLARIWGLGARRVGKFIVVVSIVWPPQSSAMMALTAMDKLLFWLGIGAAQKGAGSNKRTDSRHWVISLVVGILLALLIAAGAFILLVSQQ